MLPAAAIGFNVAILLVEGNFFLTCAKNSCKRLTVFFKSMKCIGSTWTHDLKNLVGTWCPSFLFFSVLIHLLT